MSTQPSEEFRKETLGTPLDIKLLLNSQIPYIPDSNPYCIGLGKLFSVRCAAKKIDPSQLIGK